MDVVELIGASKSFDRRYGAPTVQEHHARGRRGRRLDAAVREVDLAVAAGEAVAILGPRRSGRTTLLSLIRGIYRPDHGSVRVRGRATGLVAMGAGFSPRVSVASNIRLSGMLLGLTPQQIEQKRPQILAEAGLGENLLPFPLRDLPGPRRVRLSYALAMHSDPDAFLADKTLVVGDAAFREWGLAGIEAHRDAGRAVLLASNDGRVLRRICDRGVVMRGGRVAFDGRIRKALQQNRDLPKE